MTPARAGVDPRAGDIIAAGRLRVGLFPSFFYARGADGELTGWGIEMARALAGRLGVALELIERASPPAIVACLSEGGCDVAFLGLSVERAVQVDFTPPWVKADFTLLVPAGSAVACFGDADRPGVRVGVVGQHAMDIALHGKLAHAIRVYADTPDAAFALLRRGEVDVLAGIRPGLIAYAARVPGARVLADRYGANVIGLAVAKGRAAWLAYVSDFVVESKASGAAKAAAQRTGADGLDVVA